MSSSEAVSETNDPDKFSPSSSTNSPLTGSPMAPTTSSNPTSFHPTNEVSNVHSEDVIIEDEGNNNNDADDEQEFELSLLVNTSWKNEEARLAAETERMEKQEEAIRRQELLMKEQQEELSVQQRFARLQSMLGKSKFYADFLWQKMKTHNEAIEFKKQTNEARAKKRAGRDAASSTVERRRTSRNKKQDETPVAVSTSVKRSRKVKAEEEPASKKDKIEESVSSVGDQEDVLKNRSGKSRKFDGMEIPNNQPLLLTGGIMRSYQLEGYEWMASLWENGLNGILADEMGLGKTIQTIALFCHMYEMGVCGPFLVVAPLSTIPNWVNEFKRFAPAIPCILYHGNAEQRKELRSSLDETVICQELDGKPIQKVVVTSYEVAMNDRAAFKKLLWRYIVVDEGHRLKNSKCRLLRELKQYRAANRLLLTGTPLQNNLSELWSLLNYILPEIFDDLYIFESWFNAKDLHEDKNEAKRIVIQEQQNSILSTLHQILTPFLLRRVKTDVDFEIPPKKEVLVFCPLSEKQEVMYRAVLEKTIGQLLNQDENKNVILTGKRNRVKIDYSVFMDNKGHGGNDEKIDEHVAKLNEYKESLANAANTPKSAYEKEMKRLMGNETCFSYKSRLMDMRKVVNHPYLIEYPVTMDGNFYDSGPEMIEVCGKLAVLDQMLTQLLSDGHKILIFSQMTKLLDIIADYLHIKKWEFSRLDGRIGYMLRQENIERFNNDPELKLFLLSTRAGGLGINLTAADTCIIYDSDWNPQMDLQAQDRCHRIGQTKPVMIYRLVTANTIDQRIVERASAKRRLEKMIIHKSKFKAGAENVKNSITSISTEELLNLLDSKDYCGAVSAGLEGKVFSEVQLKQLLDRSDLAWGENHQSPDPADGSNKQPMDLKSVFQVVDQDEMKAELGSVKEV